MAFITSAGFSINDYFDRESDAIIKPKRPIPSGLFSLINNIISFDVTVFNRRINEVWEARWIAY